MEKSVKITLIVALAAVFIAILLTSTFSNTYSETISVRGESQVKVTPDLLTVYIGIEEKASTAKEASDAASMIYANLSSSLLSAGISEDDIKTTSLQVTPNYEWRNNQYVQDGYVARHDVKVELPAEESENVGNVIDASVNSGALINYVNFELSESLQSEKKSEATQKATEDARVKAEAIASGLDARLGSIVSVSDSSFGYTPWALYERSDEVGSGSSADEAAAATSNINPSEQIVYGSVSVVYKIR